MTKSLKTPDIGSPATNLPLPIFFILPFVVMGIVSMFGPEAPGDEFAAQLSFREEYGKKMVLYVGILFTSMTIAIAFCWRTVMNSLAGKLSVWGPACGILGAALWIAICQLQWEGALIRQTFLATLLPERLAFNPLFYLESTPVLLVLFLILRFGVLAIAVPIAEEWLLRGWLVRWIDSPDHWYKNSLTTASTTAMLGVIVYSVLTHPFEAIAAIAWFSLINWLMKRTGSITDCIVAHGTTNFILGVFVLMTGQWRLW
ncbi:MAG: CPBP family glutamic-type intramembrane protease [Pirellulaceae bacterium]